MLCDVRKVSTALLPLLRPDCLNEGCVSANSNGLTAKAGHQVLLAPARNRVQTTPLASAASDAVHAAQTGQTQARRVLAEREVAVGLHHQALDLVDVAVHEPERALRLT